MELLQIPQKLVHENFYEHEKFYVYELAAINLSNYKNLPTEKRKENT